MKNKWTECVIDASMSNLAANGLFTFCPIEGDIRGEFTVVTGMNFVSRIPPHDMKLVAIWHPDGQHSVDNFCKQHKVELEALQKRIKDALSIS